MSEQTKLNPKAGDFVPKISTQLNPKVAEFKPQTISNIQPAQPQTQHPPQQFTQQQQYNPPQKPPRLLSMQNAMPYASNPAAPPRNQMPYSHPQYYGPQKTTPMQPVMPQTQQNDLKTMLQNKKIIEFQPKFNNTDNQQNQPNTNQAQNQIQAQVQPKIQTQQGGDAKPQYPQQQRIENPTVQQQTQPTISDPQTKEKEGQSTKQSEGAQTQNSKPQQQEKPQLQKQNKEGKNEDGITKPQQLAQQLPSKQVQKQSKVDPENKMETKTESENVQQQPVQEAEQLKQFIEHFMKEGLIKYSVEFMLKFESVKKPASFMQENYGEYDISSKEDLQSQINQTNWNKKNKKKQNKKKIRQDDKYIPNTLDGIWTRQNQGNFDDLTRSEKPYAVAKEEEKEQLPEDMKKFKKIRSQLNKMTVENFEKVKNSILNVDYTYSLLKQTVEIIFEHAITQHQYIQVYTDLCKLMLEKFLNVQFSDKQEQEVNKEEKQTNQTQKKSNEFRNQLLAKCQEYFYKSESESKMEIPKDLKEEDREIFEYKRKQKILGNIKFIGSLFEAKILAENIMHECLKYLLQVPWNEENIETFCQLFKKIGFRLNAAAQKKENFQKMKEYYKYFEELHASYVLSQRVKFMVIELIELKEAGWIVSKPIEGPKKLAEVHQDVESRSFPGTPLKQVLYQQKSPGNSTPPTKSMKSFSEKKQFTPGQQGKDFIQMQEEFKVKQFYLHNVIYRACYRKRNLHQIPNKELVSKEMKVHLFLK